MYVVRQQLTPIPVDPEIQKKIDDSIDLERILIEVLIRTIQEHRPNLQVVWADSQILQDILNEYSDGVYRHQNVTSRLYSMQKERRSMLWLNSIVSFKVGPRVFSEYVQKVRKYQNNAIFAKSGLQISKSTDKRSTLTDQGQHTNGHVYMYVLPTASSIFKTRLTMMPILGQTCPWHNASKIGRHYTKIGGNRDLRLVAPR